MAERRHIGHFRKIRQIGEGTYGRVFLCEDRETHEQVAIKKVLIDTGKEGFPQTAVREIRLLATLRHENVVRLLDIVTPPPDSNADGTKTIFMVFEYLDHDLSGLLRDPRVTLSPYQVKWLMKQLVDGLKHCHQNRVLHRDIKASNVLIDNFGNLKLADFGLARKFEAGSDTKYSNKVITLWYRPPELLLGSETYGPAVDMWSVGCILAEMIEGRPLFQGQNHIDQLEVIFKLCGTPTHENWPSHTELPWFDMFKPPHMVDRCLRQHLTSEDTEQHAVDLLDKLLVLEPSRRCTAEKMLEHEYFWTDPLPRKASNPTPLLPQNVSCHEFETKQMAKRRQCARHFSSNIAFQVAC